MTCVLWSKPLCKNFKKFGRLELKFECINHKFDTFQLSKGHNSVTIKGIIAKFELDPCIVVKMLCTNF